MKWLSRTARAHPGRCACAATMAHRNTFRSFVFVTILAMFMLESPISAFTVRRVTHVTVKPEHDLVEEESSLVNVKDESSKTNIKVIELPNISLEKIIPAHTTAKVYEIKGDYPENEDKVELTTAYILLKTDDGYLKITGLPVYTSAAKEEISSTLNDEVTYVPDVNEEILRKRRQKNEDNVTATVTSDFTTADGNSDFVSTQTSGTVEGSSTANIKSRLTDILSREITTIELPSEIATTDTDYTSGTPIIESRSINQFDSSTTMQSVWTDSLTENVKTNSNVNKLISTPPVLPFGRKYTTINRKREETVTDSTTATNFKELPREETPPRFTLEKVLNETTISSLEAFKIEQPSNSNTFTGIPTEIDTAPTASSIYISESDTLTSPLETKTTFPRIRQSSSKRAGFLDYSAKPIAGTDFQEVTTIVENFDPTSISSSDENFRKSIELEVPNIDSVLDNKTEIETQTQLAEDAMKEDLLKEDMLSDNGKYAKRIEVKNAGKHVIDIPILQKSSQETVDDTLSVKPIEYEKGKYPAKYTVSPNYKPLKKIEVQSQKPIVRDPDDNSWRNESISSLGIVFKPKAASKNYTEVLKNKTEALLSSSLSRENKNDVPDLKERLEKIAEVRKSKKKKVLDKFGEPVYSDYEDTLYSVESLGTNTPTLETTFASMPPTRNVIRTFQSKPLHTTHASALDQLYNDKDKELNTLTTEKPKIYNTIQEYYDTTDEYDFDYLNLPKIDLKKYTPRVFNKETLVTTLPTAVSTKPTTGYLPERKPTVQYFPPRVTPKVNNNDYDGDFQRKVNLYTYKEPPKTAAPNTFATTPSPSVQHDKYEQFNKKNTIIPTNYNTRLPNPANIEKNVYSANSQRISEPPMQNNGYTADNGNYDRGSYVIRHYKDFIDEAVRDNDYDKNAEYVPYPQAPVRGVTVNDLGRLKHRPNVNDEFDYETQFRKDILSRFIDNFNQNNERFKVDFPILFNNSVLHRKADESGKVLATSTAFMKRLYGEGSMATKPNNYMVRGRPCENCDNITVELSPAYELHYYVPEQEEREEAEPQPVTLAYRYTL
ncbi:uncharacterized protein LOC113510008 [Galleria mellonella]|uniref:Uncharacterized protein LOC113510008 n=1 Tax=Galleria mellonella TaxID=7137 RepID=A0ABM3MI46_GALME|nr:uncharacterized protein LOC113510008 [Galleria mellonella]